MSILNHLVRAVTTAVGLAALTACSGTTTPSTPAGASSPATTSPTVATPSTSPSAGTQGLTAKLPLSDSYSGGPLYWAVSQGPGWEIKAFDQGGVNQFVTPGGCQLTTRQMRIQGDPGATDEISTRGETDAVLASAAKRDDSPISDTAWLPYAVRGSEPLVEFSTVRFDYVRSDNGEKWTSYIGVRNFVSIGVQMTFNISCPIKSASAADADGDLASRLVVSP